MKDRRKLAVLLCGVLLLTGCGNAKTEESVGDEPSALTRSEEIQPDNDSRDENAEESAGDTVQKEENANESNGATALGGKDADKSAGNKTQGQENTNESGKDTEQNGQNTDETGNTAQGQETGKEGTLVIEAGPDKKLYETGSLIYTLHDFKLYESPDEAGIDRRDLELADARYYMDRSIFLMMQADIHNIDFEGDDEKGELNVSRFIISPNQQDEALQWEGSYPVYVKEHGTGETDYYHVYVKPGETKTVTIGFYVPVKDAGELKSQCKISFFGSYEEGYVYDIPEVW